MMGLLAVSVLLLVWLALISAMFRVGIALLDGSWFGKQGRRVRK
jgi:hypothetical protein